MRKCFSVFDGVSDVKRRSALLLAQRGNLLRLVFAALVSFAVFEAVFYAFQVPCSFLSDESKLILPITVVGLTLAFLIAAPLILSVFRMAHRMVLGEVTDLNDIFYYFSIRRFRDVGIISVFALYSFLFQFIFSFAFGRLIIYIFEGFEGGFYSDAAIILAVVFMPFFSGAFTRVFMLPVAYFECGDLKEAFKLAGENVKGQPREILLFNISFIPIMLLSVLTLGILFFVYILPLYILSQVMLASSFIKIHKSENFRK